MLCQRIRKAVETISDNNIRTVTINTIESNLVLFKAAPASVSIHHGYLGGLVEHTLSVLNLAVTMAKQSPENLDMDLIIAGAILHDIGKIETYTWERGFIERSRRGRLIEHIVIGTLIVQGVAHTLNISFEEIEKLMHIIVSHHGKREWGSPIEPATKEAMIIHRADELDSKMALVDEAIAAHESTEDWLYLKPDNIAILTT